MINKDEILRLLETAVDKDGDIPMRLVRMAFDQLPETCEDAVSRQAAIDALGEKPLVWTEGEYETGCQNQWEASIDAIKALPSVTPKPKTGKWIKAKGDWVTPGGDPVWECSECGKGRHVYGVSVSDGQWVACPNCGTEMTGEEWR